MTALEALKKGFEVAKESLVLMGIVVLFNAVVSGIVIGVIGVNPSPDRIAELSIVMVFMSFFIMLAWIIFEGGIFSSLLMQIKYSNPQIDSFFSNSLKFFPRLLGIGFLSGVITMAIWFFGALITGIFIAMGQGTNPFFNILGIVLFAVVVIFSLLLIMPMLIAHYVIVIEDAKIIESLKKSIGIFKQKWGRIIALFALVALVVLLISLVTNVISAVITSAMQGSVIGTILQVAIASCVNGAISIFTSATIMSMVVSLILVPAPVSPTSPVPPVEPPPAQPMV